MESLKKLLPKNLRTKDALMFMRSGLVVRAADETFKSLFGEDSWRFRIRSFREGLLSVVCRDPGAVREVVKAENLLLWHINRRLGRERTPEVTRIRATG